MGLIPSGPARKLGSPEADHQPVCAGGSRAPCPVLSPHSRQQHGRSETEEYSSDSESESEDEDELQLILQDLQRQNEELEVRMRGADALGSAGVRIAPHMGPMGLGCCLSFRQGLGHNRIPPGTPHSGLLAPEPFGGAGRQARCSSSLCPTVDRSC